jgi:hypothetical protein
LQERREDDFGNSIAVSRIIDRPFEIDISRRAMKVTYDIFRRLPGGPIWIEAVPDLEQARMRLERLIATRPGDYFVYDASSSKIVFTAVEPAQTETLVSVSTD